VARNVPTAEFDVTVDLVRGLLEDQHPDLAGLPLDVVANGWDNAILRLGDDVAVRVPRRQLGADLVAHEQEWLPGLAERLPISIPAPVRTGAPGRGFPWSWSIVPWFHGEVAADSELDDPTREAERLGSFVCILHDTPAENAPSNQFRGFPVATLDERVEVNTAELATSDVIDPSIDVDEIRQRWADLRSVRVEWDGPPALLHGDLHTANIVAAGGEIAAVIDFGDITGGDPANDLPVAWMLFGEADRDVFRSAVGGIDDDTWRRGQAWALHFAVLYLLHSADAPRFARMGEHLTRAILRSAV
jgi:aminoglycoside phosphotransferase (APT) family kinase protein